MATQTFSVAPSVQWSERDFTMTTSPVVEVIGATVGTYQWGECENPILVTGGRTGLLRKFFKPNAETAIDWLVAADYLRYSAMSWVVRLVGPTAMNAVTKGQEAIQILNKLVFDGMNASKSISWAGRYPGSLGNDLAIDVCDAAKWPTWEFNGQFEYPPLEGEFHVVVVDKVGRITNSSGAVYQTQRLEIGGTVSEAGSLTFGGATVEFTEKDTIETIAKNLEAAMLTAKVFDGVKAESNTVTMRFKEVGPQTASAEPESIGDLTFTVTTMTVGTSGTVIPGEVYPLLQLTPGSLRTDRSNAYFKDIINQTSNWVYCLSDTLTAGLFELEGGTDDYKVNRAKGYTMLRNAEAYSAKPVYGYTPQLNETQKAIDCATDRRDCVTFVSPPRDAVLNNIGREVESVVAWRQSLLRDSSYFFMDDNWAYVYDEHTDQKYWIPACGGTAGVWARNIQIAGIYKSPAFHNRGKYSDYVRMAWSADSTQRAILYKNQINSIVTFSNEGIVLYGDKTGLTRPSAFDRINVRGTFIMAETNISAIAKYYLGENNDEFTRSLFSNTVRPYIRQLKQMGAIYDGMVKCDEDNNDAQVISNNQMVAGVWLKPEYSINWVYLDFAAVRPDIQFSEVESAGGIVAAS